MTLIKMTPRTGLTIATSDLGRAMSIVQAVQETFDVTVVHAPHPVSDFAVAEAGGATCAIVDVSSDDSAPEVRDLLARSPRVRFVFIAESLPLRHSVARVIRDAGHAVVSITEPAFVVAATAVALLAPAEPDV